MKKIMYITLIGVVSVLIIIPIYVTATGEKAAVHSLSEEAFVPGNEQKPADAISIDAASSKKDKLTTGRKVLKQAANSESLIIDEQSGALKMSNAAPIIMEESLAIPEIVLRAARGESLLSQDDITELYKKGFTYAQIEEAALQSLHAAVVESPEARLSSNMDKTAESMVQERLETKLDEINQQLKQRGKLDSTAKEHDNRIENDRTVDRQ